MISYKFTIGKKGQLTCYKSDNTLNKYTGKKALNKLEHIKDFSFHSFDSIVKENTNKKCFSMVFVSDNHVVTFDDISRFQRHADFSIEGILRELIEIAKDNNIKAEQLQQTIMEQYNIDIRKTKVTFLMAYAAMLFIVNNLPKNKTNKKTVDNTVVNTVELPVQEECIKVINSAYVYPKDFTNEFKYGIITKDADYSLEYDEDDSVTFVTNKEWDGTILNSELGVLENGPGGTYETYYDADVICPVGMDNCVRYMRDLGFDEETYPYYLREDGVRMFGDYVMVAADTNVLPKGTVIDTSLGMGMVVDHCENSETNHRQVDIAVNWTKKLTLD